MKTVIKTFILTLVLSSVTWIIPKTASGQVSVSFQVFYDDLSPYGNWVNNEDYGYVWVPDVYGGFTPYGTNGYWVYTYEGWTWVSNYSWGWAPFHYGRWTYDPYYGWIWIPDNEWGPGWVSWRRSDDYYGWAPLGPGISIDISFGSGYNLPYNQWIFVRNRDFGRTNINNYYINNSNNVTIINNTTVINNTRVDNTSNVRYNTGPDRTEVERRSGKIFTPVAIRENNKPGQNLSNGELRLYRPKVEKNNSNGEKSAPAKVVSMKDVKPVNKRNMENQPPAKQKNNDQPAYKPPVQQKNNEQRVNKPPEQQKNNDQPAYKPPVQQKKNDQPVNKPPVQQKKNDQPAYKPPVQQKKNEQPVRKKNKPPVQQKKNEQPANQPPAQQKKNEQPPNKKSDNQPNK
ncbi:MAG: hypothetical protein IPP43_07900 [Chitinophagaceae bacterium]|nr:hypothetical protein [Chitinophagaceae bacterium]